jgi:glutamate dehydrogenase
MPENNKKLIAKILNAGTAGETLKDFITKLYLDRSEQSLSFYAPEQLFKVAKSLFNFVAERNTKSVVRVFNPIQKEHGYTSERTIVETNLADSPFILDSITSYLYDSGYAIHEVLHPIILVERDAKGKIKNISDKGAAESIIHIEITHISTPLEIKKIEKGLESVLEHVQYAVGDWKAMEAKAIAVADRLAKLKESKKSAAEKAELAEAIEFVNWAKTKNFIFLGYRDYNFEKNKKIAVNKKTELGIFKSATYKNHDEQIQHVPINSDFILKDAQLVEITKSSRRSSVHRHAQMDYIGIKKYDDKGNIIGEERFIGLFTSSVYYQQAVSIPIIRQKIASVMKRAGFRASSHNEKALAAVLESHPRDELLQSTAEELFRIGVGIVSLSERPQTKIFIRRDRFLRFFSCIIYIPREFFTTHMRENIQAILEEEIGGKVMDYFTQVTDSPLARVNVLIKTIADGEASDYLLSSNTQKKMFAIDEAKLEKRIVEKTNSWLNSLNEKLQAKFGEVKGEELYRDYFKSFPEAYKDLYHPGGATLDVAKMEEVYRSKDRALDFDLFHLEKDSEESFQLKLFRLDEKITLSEILPIIENFGFQAVDEITFKISPKNRKQNIWLHHFKLKLTKAGGDVKIELVKQNFEEAILLIWKKKIENDTLNQLAITANISHRDIEFIRAYCKYLIQIRFPYSYSFITNVVAKNDGITNLFVKLLYGLFSPTLKGSREKEIESITKQIKAELQKVSNVLEDRVLNQLFNTILATLRTNFFQNKPYISFKLASAQIPNLPLPHPHAEIFVYSNEVEGTHLRFGKVARGGLRWSDRHEDFRTEVLGLVKAQQVKNSVIVPVGSKGGFVVKRPVADRNAYFEQGKECYKIFLSGMLDITDNIINGKVVHPANVVIRDEQDPYLVVAADKGTATFSDIANGVAAQYNFWLDDAFASGGSVGYDHKKMAITARGAWVSVRRHFAEMGRDPNTQEFTCVGIGDMAGDVFGNGLLLSDKYLLVGAFNHMHIFIDPTPDAAKSFKERERMFNLPRSSWLDYNSKLISKGGGIFERAAKSITVTPEMAKLFEISTKEITPDDLIKKMLTSPVDLIWNGGIGTYVKSETESNDQVGDKSNDNLRVNGADLRCKVIGEGGNLGFTQLGRIEYAKKGGRINTDAIDNSAGVDCSDHEVNIKIALRDAVTSKKITIAQRNKVLEQMQDETARLVLRDNELQTLAITIAENQKHIIIEDNIRLMEYLEQQGRLNRAIEFLPTNENLHSRILAKQGLTRPELAVLLAYSKLYVFDDLIHSKLPDDPYLAEDLFLYFPTKMRSEFKKQIENHQLRREIITTFVANSIVNRVGTTFFNRMKQETGMKGCDVARAYTVVRDAFNLRDLWEAIEKLGTTVSVETSMKLYSEVNNLVEKACGWFLRNSPQPLDTSGLVAIYKPAVKELSSHLDKIINKQVRETRDKKLEKYIASNVPATLAKQIANLEALASACDIVSVSQKTKLPLKIVGEVYFEIGMRLNIGWLRNEARGLISDNHWDNLALRSLIDAFYDQQMRLTSNILKHGCKNGVCDDAIDGWLKANHKTVSRFDNFVAELKKQDKIIQSMLTISVQKVASIL